MIKLLLNLFVLISVSCIIYSHYLRITSPHISVESGIYIRKVCLLSSDPACEAKKVNEKYENVYIHSPEESFSRMK